MDNVWISRWLVTAVVGSGFAAASTAASLAAPTAQKQSESPTPKYCALAHGELADQRRALSFDPETTSFKSGALAISDLRTSLVQSKAFAPPEILSTYESSLSALSKVRISWFSFKSAKTSSTKQYAYLRFDKANSVLRTRTDQLRTHALVLCATTAPQALVAPEPAIPATTAPTPTAVALTAAPVPTTTPAPPPTTPAPPPPVVVVVAVPAPASSVSAPSPAPTPLPPAPSALASTGVVVSPVAPSLPTAAPQPTPPPTPQPAPLPTQTPSPQPTGNATSWLALVNQARAQARSCGGTAFAAAPPIAWDNRLEEAARGHSAYQSQIRQLTHTGSGGSSAGERMTAAGFPWNYWGENIGWNYANATSMMQGWLNSPGHCSQIMSTGFTHVGWARVGAYDTMNLARLE